MSLLDRIERALFGASASERVDMMIELASRRAVERIVASLDAGDLDDDEAAHVAETVDELRRDATARPGAGEE